MRKQKIFEYFTIWREMMQLFKAHNFLFILILLGLIPILVNGQNKWPVLKE